MPRLDIERPSGMTVKAELRIAAVTGGRLGIFRDPFPSLDAVDVTQSAQRRDARTTLQHHSPRNAYS